MNGIVVTPQRTVRDGITCLDFSPNEEMIARDKQAKGYLKHSKHGVQNYRATQFLDGHVGYQMDVLDLGCGPGPTTKLLLDHGYRVTAVDFSFASLAINKASCGNGPAEFIQADLNEIEFRPNSVSGLMMSDFLQHLGDEPIQRRFLHKAFAALRPGGWFYLSFFNTNIKNKLKGDIHGKFSGRNIAYHRLSAAKVSAMLPGDTTISSVTPMNIFDSVPADRIAASMPFARSLARMILMTGLKR